MNNDHETKETPLLSVIIPTRCPDELLFRYCLSSILAQTFQNYEVLIVANGITSEGLNRISKLCPEDSRFHLLESPLAGISNARNFGLQQMRGELVTFIDDDDSFCDCSFFSTANALFRRKIDWFVSSYYDAAEPPKEKDWVGNDISLSKSWEFKDLFFGKTSFGLETRSVWGKVYLASIIRKNHICFDPVIESGGEDTLFNVFYAANITSDCAFDCYRRYFHRLRLSSATYRYNPNAGRQYLHLIQVFVSVLSSQGYPSTRAYLYFWDQLIYNIAIVQISNPQNPYSLFCRARELKRICKSSLSKTAMKEARKGIVSKKKRFFLFLVTAKLYLLAAVLLDCRYRRKKRKRTD